MKNYISINGKQTELTDEQLKQLGIVVDNKPKWEDFGELDGYYIDSHGKIIDYKHSKCESHSRNIFPSKEEAKACLTLSQLCQWRDKYNESWKPIWTDTSIKWFIYFNNCKIITNYTTSYQHVLAFKSAEIRDKFLEDFFELIMEAAPLL